MLKGLGNLGGLGDMAKMMKAAQEMQQKMADLTEELHRIHVVGESGAGLVTATCTAKGELKALDINPTIFDPTQKEVVEDLILAAIRDGQMRGNERAQTEMARIAEEMGLPPGMSLPG